MDQKNFLALVSVAQNTFITIGISFLVLWPLFQGYYPEFVTKELTGCLYFISVFSVTVLMMIRPIANIFSQYKFLCCLVTLRKGLGILSASIIIGLLLGDVVTTGMGYFAYMFSPAYWSWETKRLIGHTGDITGFILLLTSNNYSKRLLGGKTWKRVQKLAYVYFYAGTTYEYFSFGSTFAVIAIITVTFLALWAYIINWQKRHPSPSTTPAGVHE